MTAHIPFILVYLFLFIISSNGDITTCEQSSQQTHYHLRNDLLCDYYYDVRPKLNHSISTKITIKMIVKSFTYDMYTNSITVNNWLPMAWTDDHLKWTPSNYDNVDTVHFSSGDIWTPDLSLYNKHEQDSVHKIFNNPVDCIIRNTGRVSCVPPNKHQALCTADLRKYPYDTQKCILRFGSWVHAGEEIDFQLSRTAVTIDADPNGEWNLLNVTASKFRGNYSCCPNDTYPSVAFTFTIQRHASYHEATIVIPSLVIIAITLFVFYFDAEESERFYLIIASLIFHFMFIQNLTWTLPNSGENPANIIIFTRDSLILCMVEFIVTLILRRIIKASTENIWTSGLIVTLVQSRIGQALLVFDNSVKALAIAKGDEDGANIIEQSQNTSNVDYVLFAKLADRILCTIFIMIYISMFIRLIP